MFFSNKVPPKARDAYRKDAASGMLGAVMSGLTLPFFGVIAREVLHASALEISLLTVVPAAANGFTLFWANRMDGRRKMPYATWPWVAARSLFFFAIFVTTPRLFTLMVALFWMLGSIAGPAYSALMKEIYPDRDRAKIMGYARVCTLGVLMIVTAAAGPLLRGHNYRYVFPVAAVFGIASAFTFNRIPTTEATGEKRRSLLVFVRNSLRILVDDAGFRWFCAGIFVSGFANLMVAPLFTIYQVDVLGVNTQWASIYSVLAQLVAMYGYVYWGSYIDRKTSHHAIAVSALLLAVIPFAYIFVTRAWMLMPVMVLSGFVSSGIDLAYMNGIMQYAPSERITHYQAVFASLMAARGLVAPFLGVFLNQTLGMSYQTVFALVAGLILLSYFVQLWGIRTHDHPASAVSQ